MITPRYQLESIPPYIPGLSTQEVMNRFNLSSVIKLASNENPLGCPVPPHIFADAIRSAHQYPHYTTGLIDQLAQHHQVSPHQLILGNGSDEILQLIALSTLNPSDSVLTALQTFSEYRFSAALAGAPCYEIPLRNYQYDVPALLQALNPTTKLMYIANPNNPTGTILNRYDIETLMNRIPPSVLVVFDQAYDAYVTDPHWMPLSDLLAYPNVVVTRTFSKLYGLAACRIGYAISSPSIIQLIQKARSPFNVNSLALIAAQYALTQTQFVQDSLAMNQAGLRYLTSELTQRGMLVIPSQANFVCVKMGPTAKQVTQMLLERGIIIRHLASFGYPDFIRITIGSLPQLQSFVLELDTILSAHPLQG